MEDFVVNLWNLQDAEAQIGGHDCEEKESALNDVNRSDNSRLGVDLPAKG